VLLRVKVRPGSGKSEVVDRGEYLLVYLKSPAEKGRANAELVRLLSKSYGKVRIVRGFKKKTKTVLVQ
jgi:uncharacterized protein (TIGR00251 family)